MENRQGKGRIRDRAARRWTACRPHLQAHWAEWLQQRVNPLPKRMKLMLLLLFAGSAGAHSLYRMAEGVFAMPTPVFPMAALKKPHPVQNKRENANRDSSLIHDAYAYGRIRRFRMHMDSLAASPAGRRLFDSITAARPGLMDSVLWFGKMYRPPVKRQPFDQPAR